MPPSKVPAAETIALSRENGFERIECERYPIDRRHVPGLEIPARLDVARKAVTCGRSVAFDLAN